MRPSVTREEEKGPGRSPRNTYGQRARSGDRGGAVKGGGRPGERMPVIKSPRPESTEAERMTKKLRSAILESGKVKGAEVAP